MDGLRYFHDKLPLVSLLVLLPLTTTLSILANAAPFNLTTIPFDEGYNHLFGDGNLVRSPDGKGVRLLLDQYTGSGFISSSLYDHGFFSAKIKLPSDYTAGICVAFYTSNADVFEKSHDELDIEFLGNRERKPWRFQTNLYGNGSTNRGREERYRLWFDPTKDFHRYSILWTPNNIIFYVDEVPIREVVRKEAMGGDYPSKPMSLYATIWDASNWATDGGKAKVNYKFAPFVAEFKDLVLEGCPADPIEQFPFAEFCAEKLAYLTSQDYSTISHARRAAMRRFRQRYMYYSYCYDSLRYPVPMPECEIIPAEKARFKDTGRLKFGGSHKKQPKRRSRNQGAASDNQVDM
ncbi:putative xyloglucan:xyloglucosyl transferase [Rosa chinensis]|uniref:Xyloglucan endotransglucosylase/hydrolase n=2 Tax=Rosa TaxID=3764 RepID=A0A2P6PAM6_ROSCH|nr:probable xyloglucan endotransglucosylase/hydrolase protein 30 [Rosa chinensis]AFR46573.1 xyloglucan endotransglucosylase/hydrolase 4 [Rosa x burboniana]PRQ18977.1 putative xyloglucan:xyloglucosyl transferase [Rosa chinensis]